MTAVPAAPKIYHITHIENLASIVACGALRSDARMLRDGGPSAAVGLSGIKRRRLELLDVRCHPGTRVGEYVPFYFCPRSVMLYILHKGNHPDLEYRGGQEPIVHLEADLRRVVAWADQVGRRWAFSTRNAGAWYTDFYCALADLEQVAWQAVRASDFRDPAVKENKQAEFLVYDSFPWSLVERVGVVGRSIQARVTGLLQTAIHQPQVCVRRGWYY